MNVSLQGSSRSRPASTKLTCQYCRRSNRITVDFCANGERSFLGLQPGTECERHQPEAHGHKQKNLDAAGCLARHPALKSKCQVARVQAAYCGGGADSFVTNRYGVGPSTMYRSIVVFFATVTPGKGYWDLT